MTILGALVQGLGRGQNLYDYGSAAGPASYVQGTGVAFTSLVTAPKDWEAWTDDQTLLRANNKAYGLVNSISGAVITSLVYELLTNGAAAWAETANSGNFAGKTFRYRAVGI